ncbi:MAG: peptidoglycan-binding protein, partial [Gammaproteobacteria bacterium]
MYKEFFRLRQYPFQNTTDPSFFFEGEQHREALARMQYGIVEGKGLVLVTGKVGSGKTTLAKIFVNRLGPEWKVIFLDNPWLTAAEFLRYIYRALSGEGGEGDVPLSAIHERLLALEEEGKRVLLVVDEAQLLPLDTLQAIRLLYNLETPERKLIQVLLLAQDEFMGMLQSSPLRAFKQRISLFYHLGYLSLDETDAYIQHRLRVAGADPYLFPRHCVERIYQASQGCPRVINQICDDALLFAYGRNQARIIPEVVEEAIAKWREHENPERIVAPEPPPQGQPSRPAPPPQE